jgi:hypothetical protein
VLKDLKVVIRVPKVLWVLKEPKVLKGLKGQVREPKERQGLLVHKEHKEHKVQIRGLKVVQVHKALRET